MMRSWAGCTPLHAATLQALTVCREGAAAPAGQGGSIEVALAMLECLVLNGGSINAQDSAGKAPMHYAAEDPHGERVLAWLIGHKASPALRDHQGYTPAALALARGGGGDYRPSDNNSHNVSVLVAQQQDEANGGGGVGAAPSPPGNGASGDSALGFANGATASGADHGADESDESDDDGNVVHSGSNEYLSAVQQQQNGSSSGVGDDAKDVQSAAALVAAVETVPYPWKAFIDVSSGDTYYFNQQTNATSWDFPSEDGTAVTTIDTDL